eukprot:TRINITY_DN2886_c0_g1_i6.p1 TRINITY_DN2886_c0_g1~~TRINITY_DN2886_c0_g1_i6.p1  ORF type:complete len:526 (-),score=50.81 TRINITY_DN2886_c0_g1_i6:61-1638(-)
MLSEELVALEDTAQIILQAGVCLENAEISLEKFDTDGATNLLDDIHVTIKDARGKLKEASKVVALASTTVENALILYKKNQANELQNSSHKEEYTDEFLKNEILDADEEIDMKIEEDFHENGDSIDDPLDFEHNLVKENDLPIDENDLDDLSFKSDDSTFNKIDDTTDKPYEKSEENTKNDQRNSDNKNPPFICKDCDKEFAKRAYLRAHENFVHKAKGITCDLCGFQTSNAKNLRAHKKLKHPTTDCTVVCDECSQVFKNPKYLKVHKENVHNAQQARCVECGFISANIAGLKRHILMNHRRKEAEDKKEDDDQTLHHCNEPGCQAKFKQFRYLKVHIRDHHILAKVACEECGIVLINKYGLARHVKMFHSEGCRDKNYQCDQCEFAHHDKKALLTHIEVKHGNTTFKCDICHFETKSRFYLSNHKRRVHKEKKFKCSKCDYTCLYKSMLTLHTSSVHEGLRFSCDLCDYTSRYKGDLNVHKRVVHEGLTISCAHCDYSTNRKYKLKNHMRNKHEIDITKQEEC